MTEPVNVDPAGGSLSLQQSDLKQNGDVRLVGERHQVVADFLAELRFTSDQLIPAIAQQWDSGEVLMMAWMNEESLRETFVSGRATYWSRSRNELWRKGDTSGHTQRVLAISRDCDSDVLLLRVDQVGPACHTGSRSCFDTETIDLPLAADSANGSSASATNLKQPEA